MSGRWQTPQSDRRSAPCSETLTFARSSATSPNRSPGADGWSGILTESMRIEGVAVYVYMPAEELARQVAVR